MDIIGNIIIGFLTTAPFFILNIIVINFIIYPEFIINEEILLLSFAILIIECICLCAILYFFDDYFIY